ncbi:MAG TPA: penicillin-binding transpeptidase domain-containing protein [Actinomycetota bacterium]|nr:penicillin-binding transpeptidase domain-containing protein [Actinomycetota bacterium]
MDRQVRWLAMAFVALFVVLFAQVNYLQVFGAEGLANNPANRRLLLQEYNVDRGEILASDRRTVLARSEPSRGRLKYRRLYPAGDLYGHLTGYYSVLFGRSGLEASANDFLAGRAPELLPQNLVDEILGRDKRGASVVTTIDPVLQKLAAERLGSLPGAVVAMDPQTGDVLAMVGNPSFDPTELASHSLKREQRAWKSLNDDPSKPLISRAAQEVFPPGSTFKIVTAAAALENGMTPETRFPNPPELDLPQTTHVLNNFGGGQCPGGSEITLAIALQFSCNVVWGEVGLELGAERLVNQARRFGFDGDVPFDVPFAEGQIPPANEFEDALPAVAFSAIGQQSVAANPLQMALVASAIANGGTQMRPRLIHEIRDPSGRILKTFEPEEFGRPMSARTADALTQMMVAVVEAGTATTAQIPDIPVAGKTGTAQTVDGRNPHAWFVSFAPAEDPQIVVAVVVLNGGSLGSDATGGVVAAPIAKALMESALTG